MRSVSDRASRHTKIAPLATGVAGSTRIAQETVTAAEMLQPISAVDARAALRCATRQLR